MNYSRGFTITELMFSISILAIVLLILLGSTIQLTRTYNKGITLKRVNQSGRTVGEELTRSIRLSGTGSVNASVANSINRVCFGSNSFIWLNDQSPTLAKTLNKYDSGEPITGFVKVSGENMCSGLALLSRIPTSKATQVLGGDSIGDNNDGLVMRSVQVNIPNNSKLVNVKYVISTPSQDLISAASCGGNDDFCALNEFNVTVYARGY